MAWQEGYKKISANNPLPVDGDSVYGKDVDIGNSDIGTFTGDILSLFTDYTTEIVDETATNPKTYTIRLKRPVKSNEVAIGSQTGNFSNVKVKLKDLAGTVRTVVDDSASDTKHTSNRYPFTANVFIEIVVEFHTADAVKVSGMYVPKVQSRAISAIDGYVSETNTTEEPLLGDGVFTGSQVDTLNYGMAIVAVYSDVASATDGLSIQFRSTATGTWREADAYTIAAGAEKTFSIQTVRRFMRIVYTNGAGAQSTFDMQVVMKPVYVKPSSHRVADAITGQDDAELVKAVITGENPGGTFINFQSTTAGNFKTSIEELETGVSDDSNSALKVSPYLVDEFGSIGRMLSDNYFLGAPVVINSEHHEIHCGDSYLVSRIVDLGNGASDDILIIVPDEAGSGQSQKLYHFLPRGASEAEVIWYLYEAPTVSANGTAMTAFNRNRNSAFTSDLEHYHTPTVTTVGTLISTDHAGSGRGTGGEARSEEFVLKNNTKYLLRVTNQTASNNYIDWHLNHYIHPGI
jgi:hypothetical protein